MFLFWAEGFFSYQRANGATSPQLALHCAYCDSVYVNKMCRNAEKERWKSIHVVSRRWESPIWVRTVEEKLLSHRHNLFSWAVVQVISISVKALPASVPTMRDSLKGSDRGKNRWCVFVDCWFVMGFSVNLEVLKRTRPERKPVTAVCCPDLLQGLPHNVRGRIC